MNDTHGELRIRTPEGVLFAYEIASPVSRCLAAAVDSIVIMVLNRALTLVLLPLGFLSLESLQAVLMLAYFVTSVCYGMFCEWVWRGQSVGKRLLRLRVMDASGLRLRPVQVIVRNLVRVADMLPAFYGMGGVVMLCNRMGQRLGDLAAGTVVVRIPKYTEPDFEQLLSGKFNSLRQHPHIAARLRQNTSPREARIALQAILRRDELQPADRIKLFADLADHFKAAARFPDETVETLSDEQFVRNVVDVLFRTKA